MRGGLMFSRNILKYLSYMKIWHMNHEDTYLDEVVGYCKFSVLLQPVHVHVH